MVHPLTASSRLYRNLGVWLQNVQPHHEEPREVPIENVSDDQKGMSPSCEEAHLSEKDAYNHVEWLGPLELQVALSSEFGLSPLSTNIATFNNTSSFLCSSLNCSVV